MHHDRIGGRWKEFKGQARENWGRVTGNQNHVEQGQRERHAGKLQRKHGAYEDEAREQIRELQSRY
ncbi:MULTISPECIES: CsbD family protein [unclassified Methylibium]|jgi:uncharacterized protein YjbJ (UPF0337 family)